MPRLARPKKRACDGHQLPRISDSQPDAALELRLPSGIVLLSMLSSYFDSLPRSAALRITFPSNNNKRRQRRTPKPFASISISSPQAPPQPDTPEPVDNTSARLPLPQWLSRAMQGQLPAALWVVLSPPGQPDKRRLMTVHDFFRYTEEQGRALFKELDRDGDERVSLDDLKVCYIRPEHVDGGLHIGASGRHAAEEPSRAFCCRVFESSKGTALVGQQHHVRHMHCCVPLAFPGHMTRP